MAKYYPNNPAAEKKVRNYLATLTRRRSAVPVKTLTRCQNGPWAGYEIPINMNGDRKTAWFKVGDLVGRYVYQGPWAKWEPKLEVVSG